MADTSGRRGKRRRLAVKPAAVKTPCKSSPPPTLSSSLLLQIPPHTNTSLPVWDAMRSQQAGVTWTVSPYSVSVHLTPVSPEASTSSPIPPDHAPQGPPSVLLQLVTCHPQKLPPASDPPPSLVPSPQPAPIPAGAPESPPRTLPARSEAPAPSTFCTKSSADVLICDDFLLGLCREGRGCTMHHTPYPFHWQLWSICPQQWVDLPPPSQVLLERMYCHADRDDVVLMDGAICNVLSFDTMELDDLSKYDRIRRLTNSDSTDRNPHFPSRWKIYWCGDDKFEEYQTDLSTLLLKKIAEKVMTCTFHIGTQMYKVDFTCMTQTNVSTGFQREVRYRPVYRPARALQPYLRTGMLPDPTPPDGTVPGENFSVDPLVEFSSWYPPVWSPASLQDYSIVDVSEVTRVYQSVAEFFHQSLTETRVDVVGIQQIQNPFQWDKYQRQKTHMQKRPSRSQEPLERHLFHGTTAGASEGICRHNFDPRLAGVHGNSHGYGCYFATKAWVSDGYTGVLGSDTVRHIFLAKVLVGRATVGKQHYRRPPALGSRAPPHDLYDACVDSREHPGMFVVFDSCQCYPYYLIKYRTLPTEIPISK